MESKEGSDQAGAGHSPLDRRKGQTKLAQGMVRWGRWKGQTRLAQGTVRWSRWKGRTARSLTFGWSSGALTRSGSRKFKGRPRDSKTIGSVQLKLPFPRSIDRSSTGARGVHQATAPGTQLVGCDGDWPACRAWSVGTDGRVKPPVPWLLACGWASDPLQVPRIQGRASGQQDDGFRPA